MRILINGVPRVCEGLLDQSKCEIALKYCNASDSEAICTAKLISKATMTGRQGIR